MLDALKGHSFQNLLVLAFLHTMHWRQIFRPFSEVRQINVDSGSPINVSIPLERTKTYGATYYKYPFFSKFNCLQTRLAMKVIISRLFEISLNYQVPKYKDIKVAGYTIDIQPFFKDRQLVRVCFSLVLKQIPSKTRSLLYKSIICSHFFALRVDPFSEVKLFLTELSLERVSFLSKYLE